MWFKYPRSPCHELKCSTCCNTLKSIVAENKKKIKHWGLCLFSFIWLPLLDQHKVPLSPFQSSKNISFKSNKQTSVGDKTFQFLDISQERLVIHTVTTLLFDTSKLKRVVENNPRQTDHYFKKIKLGIKVMSRWTPAISRRGSVLIFAWMRIYKEKQSRV